MNPKSLYPNQAGYAPTSATPIGGVVLRKEPISYNTSRPIHHLKVRNTGDRPVQVGSHFHLFEVNRLLEFDRSLAFGCHLNIPATTAIRFEPGDEKSVEVVPFAGKRRMVGFNGLVQGYSGEEDAPDYLPVRTRALHCAQKRGFRSSHSTPPHTKTEK